MNNSFSRDNWLKFISKHRQDYRQAWREVVSQFGDSGWFASLTFSEDYLVFYPKEEHNVCKVQLAYDELVGLKQPEKIFITEEVALKAHLRWLKRLEFAVDDKVNHFVVVERGRWLTRPHLHSLIYHPKLADISIPRWERKWLCMNDGHGVAKILSANDMASAYITKQCTDRSELFFDFGLYKELNATGATQRK